MKHLSKVELEEGLEYIYGSPTDNGELRLIVRRPVEGGREVLEEGQLDLELGLVGDKWKVNGSSRTTDGFGHPDMQINIMNYRAAEHLAVESDRIPLAGDQLYLDMNLGDDNLPTGTRLQIGEALLEITEIPHNGCRSFADRFGVEAVKFVNSPEGKKLHLRGINAKVVKPGIVRVGDRAVKVMVTGDG